MTGDGASQTDGRADAALRLIPLADDLQRLGYPYEAYQLREAAARLLRGVSDEKEARGVDSRSRALNPR
jgi:hypothetical protein